MSTQETLSNVVISRANEDSRGITFILSGEHEVFVSYKEMYLYSLELLYYMQQAGFKKGDEVVFQLEDNRKFMFSFWACVLGGMIPVPVTPGTNDEHKMKLFKIWNILKKPKLIASGKLIEKLEEFASENDLGNEIKSIRENVYCFEEINLTGKQGVVSEPNPEDTAFIQFSSGSTGDPKGVVISHKNVLTNITAMAERAQTSSGDSTLSWMPLTHDMGLVGVHIVSVFLGINQYNMQTQLFIRYPVLWIKKASQHKATMLYSPNFGYKHFLKFFNKDVAKDWDLSNVRLVTNGAEPISIELCDEFMNTLSEYGLKRNTMYTVYGMAEATLGISFPDPGEEFRSVTFDRETLGVGDKVRIIQKEDKRGVTFADEGYPISDCYLRICDENNNPLEENYVGHIQIKGGNVTCGYYNRLDLTKEIISPDGWLDTGDLGLMINGRLIVAGRSKDIIFSGGQNFYSHDIERVAESVEGVELGKIAAVGVFNEAKHSDELVLFVLFKQKTELFLPLVERLKKIISLRFGIEAQEVIPVKHIPKTTSGKFQRYKLREAMEAGEFDAVKQEIHELMAQKYNNRVIDLPQNDVENELVKIWSEVLNIEFVGTRDDFFAIGGDSLKAGQLISRVRETFGVELCHSELFENSDIVELAKLIENYSKKLQAGDKDIAGISSEGGKMPLSSGQNRLYFLDRLNSGSSQYNLNMVLRIHGEVKRDALQKSLCEVVKRHKVLSVTFAEENGQPVQLYNDLDVKIPFVDLSAKPDRENSMLELATAEAARPFELDKGPLFRSTLVGMGEREYVFIFVVHHIVFDGWSFGILLKELSHYYNVFSDGEHVSLEDAGIQYPDVAVWQMKRMEEEGISKQLEYWKGKLSGKLPVMELPADRQRPPVQSFKGAKFRFNVPEEMVKELQTLAQQKKVTMYMLLLAAFDLLLYRYTNQEDIIVGSPVANRTRSEMENVIGYFTNNLVLRTNISEGYNFDEFLKQVKQVTLEAYRNQEVPFEKLVEVLKVERDMSRNPLFQVLFSLQNMPLPQVKFGETSISPIDIDSKIARFDLALDIREVAGEMVADFEYNTDLFNEDTIARMAGHYNKLLQEITADSEKSVQSYDFLTQHEKEAFMKSWEETALDLGGTSCWVELFEEMAEKFPSSVAVAATDGSITYEELNKRANRLAHYLKSSGMGPEKIVGVFMNRTIDMMTALIGIHKASAAYLPMDPLFPKDRLAYMLEDADVDLILTQEPLIDMLPDNESRIIPMDSEWAEIEKFGSENPEKHESGNNLAYLIYTSGSTGRPKGVQIEQYALLNLLKSMEEKTGVTNGDSLLAVTTLSFDIAGLELFMPMIAGAKVVIAGRDDVTDGNRMAEMLEEHNITLMQATPATWRLLIESGWKGAKNLKILCGGEALPKDLAGQLLERCGCLLNVYGPTETTIWSTLEQVDSPEDNTIGKPIANTRVYILDKAMNHLPFGVPGELYIGGEGLARGYINQPELSAEKFVADPFIQGKWNLIKLQTKEKASARMYRTGDMARLLPDGRIEFLGRADQQVKIRGFRIELGEIETLLNQNPSIKESVVAVKELIPGQNALVAYIIPEKDKDSKELGADVLRRYLKEMLPDYMIPSAFVCMEAFPMTPNRKIDRKALAVPQGFVPQLEGDFTAPSDEVETRLVEIWQEVLNLNRVGVKDNFFDLGGHSLLLTKVRNKIKEIFNKEVSTMDLFKYTTIEALSRHIKGETEDKTVQQEKRIKRESKGEIAVIGMSGRFPGAKNIEEFWSILREGKETIGRFSDEEVLAHGISESNLKKPEYVKAWGVLEDADKFDAAFFGYNPGEAELLDPQQRVFLEEAWKAFEDAGYDSEKNNGLVGVFASSGMNTYSRNILESRESKGLAGDYQIMTSNDKDFLATRVAYKLNLEGPGITVQTACSSSLVAVHLACRSLRDGECDMALAGGVSIRMPQKAGYLYQEGMILSPDGHCRAFDQNSKGTVGGNGAGVVVLKRLEDAIADGDNIIGVIKGSAINNDGASKIGYTAPRVDGQMKVIEKAQESAGVSPESITYIEAHGTGTPLGDPIEIEALTGAFRKRTSQKGFCAVGSVKTNIGHLDSAAGVTGLIKTLLSLKHRMLPPSLNFKSPNPGIDFENSPFFVNNQLCEWKRNSEPLRAGVSSFGIGGTNVHVVVEEAPEVMQDNSDTGPQLLVFSAKTRSALESRIENFKDFLNKNSQINMADAAYTLMLGRREMEYRCFVVASSREDAVEKLGNVLKDHQKAVSNSSNKQKNIKGALSQNKGTNCLDGRSLEEIGQSWLAGDSIDWKKLYERQKRRRISLPVYTFEGKSFWIDGNKKKEAEKLTEKADVKKELSEWFYMPVWKQSSKDFHLKPVTKQISEENVLVFAGKGMFTSRLVEKLREFNKNIITVFKGDEYRELKDDICIIRADVKNDYEELLKTLSGMGKRPARIVHLLGIDDPGNAQPDSGEELFYSLLYLAQAVGSEGVNTPLTVKVLLNGSQKVFSPKELNPQKALHSGPCKVIPVEYPYIKMNSVDFILPDQDSEEEQDLIEQLAVEVFARCEDEIVAYRGTTRFEQDFDKIQISEESESNVPLKEEGVYLVTGGLGGMGLVMAEYLARKVRAKLVLVGRSQFPQEEEWDRWISENGLKDKTSEAIQKLKNIRSIGAQVLTCQGDVTDIEQMNAVRQKAESAFGKVNGVIHAAGNPGGGMIQLKKREFAQNVILPKVAGTEALYKVFANGQLDFFICCSSLNAITGGFGQVDYSAANAYLDAFAQAHYTRRGTRMLSINWDRWPGTGMAAGNGIKAVDRNKVLHPLLGRKIESDLQKSVFLAEWNPKKDWVLSEHLVMGTPTIAGTTYLETVRAAIEEEEALNKTEMEFTEVIFLAPMTVKEDESRTVCTVLEKAEEGFTFQVVSRWQDGDEAGWQQHVKGRVKALTNKENPEVYPVKELIEACNVRKLEPGAQENDPEKAFISFGKRWISLRNLYLGVQEGISEIELAEEFASDLIEYKLHPALLDVATGSVRLAAGGNYLPFSYGSLNVNGPLRRKMYAHIQFKNGYDGHEEIITSDIHLMDEQGLALVEIKDFSMRLTGEAAAAAIRSGTNSARSKSGQNWLEEMYKVAGRKETSIFNEGISPKEGQEVLELILKGCVRPQVIVSVKEIREAIRQANYIKQSGNLDKASTASNVRHPRPELQNAYVAPKNETEKKLVEIWQDTLMIDGIGIHDEFFELGGDSLLLIQFHSKLKEEFKSDIAVVDLYKYNTVNLLSKYLTGGKEAEKKPAFDQVNSRVNKQLEIMNRRKQEMLKRRGVKV